MPNPAIDFTVDPIDHARLERCLALQGRRVGPGRYRSTGGDHTHWVDRYTATLPRCDCGDLALRGLVQRLRALPRAARAGVA